MVGQNNTRYLAIRLAAQRNREIARPPLEHARAGVVPGRPRIQNWTRHYLHPFDRLVPLAACHQPAGARNQEPGTLRHPPPRPVHVPFPPPCRVAHPPPLPFHPTRIRWTPRTPPPP